MIELHTLINDPDVDISGTCVTCGPSFFRLASKLISCKRARRKWTCRADGIRPVVTVHSPETAVEVFGIVRSCRLLMGVDPVLLDILYSRRTLKLVNGVVGTLVSWKIHN